jgi:hypothetical protein
MASLFHDRRTYSWKNRDPRDQNQVSLNLPASLKTIMFNEFRRVKFFKMMPGGSIISIWDSTEFYTYSIEIH